MRRFALTLGWLAVVVLLAAFTLPWWFGSALSRVGPAFGLTTEGYERSGENEFTLRRVEYRRAGVRVVVNNLRTDMPLRWWWRRMKGDPSTVVAGKWITEVTATEPAKPSKSPRGWVPLRHQLERVVDIVDYWLPSAQVGSGTVTWPGGGLNLGAVTWKARTLETPLIEFRALRAAVRLEAPRGQELRATLTLPEGAGDVSLQSAGPDLSGVVRLWEQRADFSAKFPAAGWRPVEAAIRSKDVTLPGEKLRLGSYYSHVRGNAQIEWRNENLTAVVSVNGEPVPNAKAPPLAINVNGHGADGMFVADAMDVRLPGITARLSDPVRIDRTGKLLSAASRFVASCNLAEQPWFKGSGTVEANGTISPGTDGLAKVVAKVTSHDLSVGSFALAQAGAEAEFEWPRLVIRAGRVKLPDGNDVTVQGGLNLKTHDISDAVIRGTVGRALIARWLPESVKFDTISVDARASGEWKTFSHDGSVVLGNLRIEKLHPLAIAAKWKGHGLEIERLVAEVTAGRTVLQAEGALNLEGATVSALTFKNGDETRYSLVRPANLHWKPQLEIEPLELQGPQTLLRTRLVWGKSGTVDLALSNLQSEWFREVVQLPATIWAVDSLDGRASWENGPATISLHALGTVHLAPDRAAQLSTQLTADAHGVKVSSLRIAEGSGEIVVATGQFPVTVTPRGAPWLKVDDDAPFLLQAASSPNPSFWDKLSELAGIQITNPQLTVNLSGTWPKPKGEAQVRADRIVALPDRFKFAWPKIEALDLRLVGDADGVKLDHFTVAVDEQRVRASGTLPLSADRWSELLRDPRAFARHGNLRVEIPDADIAAIAHHFPAYLAPKGRLQLDLTLKSDETITGFFRVTDATSRPLGPLGVLQEINAHVIFEGRAANLQGVTAKMGGQAVTLQGRAELPKGAPPRIDLTLKGENLPFVRQTGLLLRGDLDLKLAGAGTAATISGNVRLRDSLFLSDVRALIPTGAKGSSHRPPYFSIEAPALTNWRMNVTVTGDRFMRLRTPVFTGTASARFRLSGTLGDPRIEGEAVVDEGNVRLPFANFTIQQGQVRLSQEQLEPQIWVTGTTRRYGYDVRMELTGSTSSQNLTFTSSPPLEAEQVLLMVMAGQAPQNEVTTTDRQRVARFGAFFGQSLLGSIGGDSGGAERLTISSGENVSAQGRETYSIEYRLDNRWSLTGEYDEFDDYYGGLKWRFYERGGRKPNDKK